MLKNFQAILEYENVEFQVYGEVDEKYRPLAPFSGDFDEDDERLFLDGELLFYNVKLSLGNDAFYLPALLLEKKNALEECAAYFEEFEIFEKLKRYYEDEDEN